MFRLLNLVAVSIALICFAAPSIAKDEEAKEVKLTGTITCAKCDLKVAEKCATVIKVDDKVYYLDDKAGKANHKAICTEAKEGTITGKVSKDGDKLIITVTKLEFKK